MAACTAKQAVKASAYYTESGGYYEKATGALKYLTRDKSNFAANRGSGNYSWAGRVCALNPAPWCAMHNSTAVYEACGNDKTAAKAICWGRWPHYNCGTIMDDAKAQGRWHYGKAYGGSYTPQPGDWVVFTYYGGKTRDHTGMVKAVSGGYVYVIEGNKSNMCKVCSYALGNGTILGYATPNYKADETPNTPIAQYQAWLTNIAVDEVYGPETKKAAIYWHEKFTGNATADGVWDWDAYAYAKVCQYGDNNWDSHIVQGQLYCLGYDPKGFDGAYGSGTQTAVEKLQTDKGLPVTGIVDADTWAALFGEKRPAHTTLKKGSKGGEVYYLQMLMWEAGYYLGCDGVFGSNTDDDVRDFQHKNGLTVDGVVGTVTWGKIDT